MNPTIKIEVLRARPGFVDACRVAAAGIAMAACANAAHANAPVAPQAGDNFFNRPAAMATPATEKLSKLLSNQDKHAEDVTSEQAQTLKYGKFPPIKTTVQIKGKVQTHWTLHPFDLVGLAREAAREASRIEGIKIDPAKVGAVMMTESSLVARTGWSSNGKTPSFGLAQLETNTARSLGVKDPNDPRQSALAAARLIAEGMRFARSNHNVDERLTMSLAYNTSSALRKSLVSMYGSSLAMHHLPQATQHHVKNMAYGESRMALFAKLSDQYDSYALKHVQAQPQRASYTTATPAPSTKALVASLSSEQANRLRLEHNQVLLEKEGHLQAIPMTAKGLMDIRMAIADRVQNLGERQSPATALSQAQVATVPASISSRVIAELAALAQMMKDKVSIAALSVRDRMTSTMNEQPDHPARSTTPVLKAANNSSEYFVNLVQLARLRERFHQKDLIESPRPT